MNAMETTQNERSTDDEKRALERALDQKLRLLDEARQARDFWRGELYATLRDVADARRTKDDLRRDFAISRFSSARSKSPDFARAFGSDDAAS